MDDDAAAVVVPRTLAEGRVPLVDVAGPARDCGRQYARIVVERWPGYRRYLDGVAAWGDLEPSVRRLFDARAPHIPEVFAGMLDVAGSPQAPPERDVVGGCTSFGVSGAVTLDGHPLSGQTKDTAPESAELYIVLRMRIRDAPTILVLAYPGELLGYGLWSTGMSVFRNSLHSSAGGERGLSFVHWALLALAGDSVDAAVEMASAHGIAGAGNALLSDGAGRAASVEYNGGGVNVVPACHGIATHANHPVGADTAPFAHGPPGFDPADSRLRMSRLAELLHAERGRLTAQRALMALADHSTYPNGLCRHLVPGARRICTTAAVVAEPTAGRLHVTRGQACMNWPTTYTTDPSQ